MHENILLTEKVFDQDLPLQELEATWPEAAQLIEASRSARWEEVYSLCEILLSRSDELPEKAFALQWAIAVSEMEFDLEKRAQWMKKWRRIPSWATHPYCNYLRAFHEATGAFYDARLRDAENLYARALQIAQDLLYPRGQMKCLFHLALTYRDRRDLDRAQKHLKLAEHLAIELQSEKFLKRIQAQQQEIQVGHPIEKLLLERKVEEARLTLIQMERKRRTDRLGRHRGSLGAYLALISFERGRKVVSDLLLKTILDPLVKVRILELKKQIHGLSEPETAEFELFKEYYGLAKISGSGGTNFKICGIDLSEIANLDIKKLMITLLKTPERSWRKDELCHTIWGLSYDPVTHDPKLYNLIHAAKKLFGAKDLFANTYGGYRINPEYLGRGGMRNKTAVSPTRAMTKTWMFREGA